jgi:ELWxxDGT repeat protein
MSKWGQIIDGALLVLLSGIGAAIGVFIGYTVAWGLAEAVSFILAFLWIIGACIGILVGGAVGGVVIGTAIGLAQQFALSNRIRDIRPWIRRGMLGWGLVGVISASIPANMIVIGSGDLSPLVWIVTLGAFVVGALQWRVLRNQIRHASWWALTGTIGAVAGSIVGVAVLGATTGHGLTDPLYGAITRREPIDKIESLGLINMNGTVLLFVTIEDVYMNDRWELWKSDGTPDGTAPVKAVSTGWNQPIPHNFTVIGETLFFSANGADPDDQESRKNDHALWQTDGTSAGTGQVKRQSQRPSGSIWPTDLVDVNGTLFGQTIDGIIWKSDGVEPEVVLIEQISGGVNKLAAGQSILYFFTHRDKDGNPSCTLWKSGGTQANTNVLAHLAPGHRDACSGLSFTIIAGRLFAFVPVADGEYDLWTSDGTQVGTTALAHFALGDHGGGPLPLFDIDGRLFVVLPTADGGHQLWTSDGTRAGTRRVKTLDWDASPASGEQPVDVSRTAFFTVRDERQGYGLWRSDGSAAGTILLARVHAYKPVNVGDLILFNADGARGGWDLWKSDGTVEGTTVVKSGFPFRPGSYRERPSFLGHTNGTLFFFANDHDGCALWKSDGTKAGTTPIKRACLDAQTLTNINVVLNTNVLVNVSGTLFFITQKNERTLELWKSDGTEAGTTLVRTIP